MGLCMAEVIPTETTSEADIGSTSVTHYSFSFIRMADIRILQENVRQDDVIFYKSWHGAATEID
jgi:hypothetical protein